MLRICTLHLCSSQSPSLESSGPSLLQKTVYSPFKASWKSTCYMIKPVRRYITKNGPILMFLWGLFLWKAQLQKERETETDLPPAGSLLSGYNTQGWAGWSREFHRGLSLEQRDPSTWANLCYFPRLTEQGARTQVEQVRHATVVIWNVIICSSSLKPLGQSTGFLVLSYKQLYTEFPKVTI